MSYQVLARKWRPGKFEEMVGQEHVLRALANALDQNRLHHAYLFTGTRGVGKTTLARIFAKCVNCETGISANPCGTCQTCEEIASGRFVDLIEIDAASHTGVSEIREILDNVQYAPTRGRFKIYLIDEVHMLSNSSFNALLKTLEEPPPHIKFLLATTDPQKLPITVLSRCLQFNLKNLPEKRIVSHLAHVLDAEGIPHETEALWEIARSADGSMRDALSLTDQAIAFGQGEVRTADVIDMLGTVDRQVGRKLLASVIGGRREDALKLCHEIAQRSPDWSHLLEGMAELAHRIAMEQTVSGIVDDALGDQDFVREMARNASPEHIQLIYQIALAGLRDMPYAPTPRIGFEMSLIRMLAFTPLCPTGIIGGEGSQAASNDSGTGSEPAVSGQPAAPGDTEAVSQMASVSREEFSPDAGTPDTSRAPATAERTNDTPPASSQAASPQRDTVPEAVEDAAEDTAASPDASLDMSAPAIPEPAPAVADPADPDAWRNEVSQDDGTRAETVIEPSELIVTATPMPTPTPSGGAVHTDTVCQPAATMPAAQEMDDLTRFWLDLYGRLPLKGMVASLCKRLALVRKEGDTWYFLIDPEHGDFFTALHRERLAGALSEVTGSSCQVDVAVETHSLMTPQAHEDIRAAERQAEAERIILQDPCVRTLIETFDGTLIPGSIRPDTATGETSHV